MKIIVSLLATLSVTTAWAGSGTRNTLSSERISNFVSGGIAPATMQGSSPTGYDVRLPFGSQSNLSSISTTENFGSFQFGGDLSSLFSQLSAVNGHPLPDLTSFIDSLHLDPTFLAGIQMFIQDHN